MYTRLIGDIHGYFEEYRAIALLAEASIQIGDFGIGFAGPYWHDKVDIFHEASNSRFIRGNHDNPSKAKNMIGYIPDGLIQGHTMFIGGAWSIDQAYRTEGISWWADEELSIEEFNRLIDIYSIIRPKIMITHDAPSEATWEMFCKNGNNFYGPGKQIKTRTGEALQTMFEIHQPDFWAFGHWHETKAMTIDNTKFQCIGELDYIDYDLDALEYKL